jgi:hypothetical protein
MASRMDELRDSYMDAFRRVEEMNQPWYWYGRKKFNPVRLVTSQEEMDAANREGLVVCLRLIQEGKTIIQEFTKFLPIPEVAVGKMEHWAGTWQDATEQTNDH